MKLLVLQESIKNVTFLFFMYHSILRVWGVLITTNAWKYMVGLISSEVASYISSSWDGSFSFGSSSSQSM